jgi:aryl-alcohol dehydrogenase-like predicted oxidoreductase
LSESTIQDHVSTHTDHCSSSGKVRFLGLSEFGVDTLQRASKIHQISAYQVEYSPFSLDIEKTELGLLRACRELGTDIVAYSPLGRGILTGQIKSVDDFDEQDFRESIPRFSKENFPKNIELVNRLKSMAGGKDCTSWQLTLAWMM